MRFRRKQEVIEHIPVPRENLDALHQKFDEAAMTVSEIAALERRLQVEMGQIRREIQLARGMRT